MAALPSPFAALEPFVADWALPTEDQRSRRRWACGPDDFQAFYDAMRPCMDEVLAHHRKALSFWQDRLTRANGK